MTTELKPQDIAIQARSFVSSSRDPTLRRDQTLRLFQSLHQNDDPEFRRASGRMLCTHCGLAYREHPDDLERAYFNEAYDRRLCNGDVVHL